MRGGVTAFLLPVIVLACTSGGPCSSASAPRDLVIISVDTLRPDRLGAYGHRRATPNIDALAARGIRFTKAYAPMPRTTPALASMFTGLWPHHHGSREVRQRVRRGTFLTTPLKDAGFATIAYTANGVAGKRQGFATDFDVFEEGQPNRAADATDRVIAAMREVPSEKPLFVWAHYFDPHWPYEPPSAERWPEAKACTKLTKMDRGLKQSNAGGAAESAIESCWAAYDSEIAYTDREIGRLLQALEDLGRLDRALIVFTSDHGENFGEDGLYYAHGRSVHDAGLRVPLIITGPRVPEGRVIHEVFRLIDLPMTLLSLIDSRGAKMPSDLDGVDQSAALRRGGSDQHARSEDEGTQVSQLAFAESGGALLVEDHVALLAGRHRTGYCINDARYSLCWKGANAGALYDRQSDPELKHDLHEEQPEVYQRLTRARLRWTPGATRLRSVSDGRYKIIQRPKLEGGYAISMVDLDSDPAETRDIKGAHGDVFERLSKSLRDWTKDVPGYVQEELTDEQEAQLRALGYVE